jgi:hypothetical protein
MTSNGYQDKKGSFDDKKGGYPSGRKPVSQLPKIPPRDRAPQQQPPAQRGR